MEEIWAPLYSKDAPFKVFLTANVEERAKRRLKQLHDKALLVTFRKLWMRLRKEMKGTQVANIPLLKPAKDALIIDTSNLTINEVVAKVMALVKA